MHAVNEVSNDYSNDSSSQLQQLTSNESLKVWTHWQSDKAMTMRITLK